MKEQQTISKFEAALLSLLFLAAIWLPLTMQIVFRQKQNVAVLEARLPQPFPKLSWHAGDIKQFPSNFESYYNDNFGMRSQFFDLGKYVLVKGLNVSSSPDVLIGKNGWLFYMGNKSLDRLQHGDWFTDEQLEKWQHVLERRQQWLEHRGIRYLFVIARDKQTIYPEYLPSGYSYVAPGAAINQLVDYLAAHSNIAVVDLRAALLAEKKQGDVYYQRDSHWNLVGGFAGYQQTMNRLCEWFPELKPMNRSEFKLVEEVRTGSDLARMIGFPSLPDRELILKPLQATIPPHQMPFTMPGARQPEGSSFATELEKDSTLPKAVMLGDSFAINLEPYLSPHFSRITYVCHESSAEFEKGLKEVVEKERPQVFIEEIVGRIIFEDIPDEKLIFNGGE